MAETTAIEWADATLRSRFEAKFKRGNKSECWIWGGATLKNGYGVISNHAKQTTAHRVAYQFEHGAISSGLVVDHICRNRSCVNPAHLEAVTPGENVRRGLKGTMVKTCAHGHQFTQETTGITKQGRRFCIICRRNRDRNRRDAAWWQAYRSNKKNNG